MRRWLGFRWYKHSALCLPLIALCALRGWAADVSFYGVFKSEKYNQASSAAPTLGTGNPYRFGAVVAPTVSGSISNASVAAAGGAAQSLSFDSDYLWFSLDAKFSTLSALDTAAPAGNFTLVVNTANQGAKTLTLNLPAEVFPAAPHISNWTNAQAIDPTADFRLKWDPFTGGTTNDFILVLIANANTEVVNFRSPNPLQPGALAGTATSVLIPAADLQPSTPYLVEITFFKIKSTNTNTYPGAVGIVGFDAFTDATLMTTSSPVQLPAELAAISYLANGLVLQLTGQVGNDYEVQFSGDLQHWSDLVITNLAAATIRLVDSQAASSPARFYRAKLAN